MYLSLVTIVLLILSKVELPYFAARALCHEGFAVITLKSISALTLAYSLHG